MNVNSAIQIMMTDIIEQILLNADNPAHLAKHLTAHIRELIGGRTVVLVECKGTHIHNIITVCPNRYYDSINCPELYKLCELGHNMISPRILRSRDEVLLIQQQWSNVAIFPLSFAKTRFGLLLVFDLFEPGNVDEIIIAIGNITNLIALVLKTSMQFSSLEQIIEDRTREISLKEREFRTLAELAQVGIYKTDPQGRCVYVNQYLLKLTGLSSLNEAYGDGWIKSIHPDDRVNVLAEWNRYIRGENKFDLEYRFLRPDGSFSWVQGLATKEFDDRGEKVVGHVGTFTDLTARKEAEKKLQEATEERIKSEEQLAKHQKLESLGILAGGIAHDFNNLLTGIFGFIELAQSACASEDYTRTKRYLDQTQTSFNRAKDLARRLLTFSKGGAPITKISSVASILENSSTFALSGSNVGLELKLAPDLWNCLLDENQIGQVLDNLMINAKQAMPMGGMIRIIAKNLPTTESKKVCDYVYITVADHGVGIPTEDLPHIFDPFFTTKQQGSGLGLSIVYSIIKRHDGLIDVTSEVEKGTVFHIYLPRAKSEETFFQSRTSLSIKKSSHQKDENFYTGNVLIMDDEEALCQLFSSYFQIIGCNTVSAQNGDDAKNFFAQALEKGTPFDIVMLDLTIPGGKGGKEIILELRKMSGAKAPPFFAIAASGHSSDPVIAKPQMYAFDEAIQKPFRYTNLMHIVQKRFSKNFQN